MDSGPEAIADVDELARIRAQARTVHLKSLALATMMVAAALALPPWV